MKSRILMGIGALLLLLLFKFPIWKISLDAPQYPEGINMYIWINNINGENGIDPPSDDTEHVIANINLLNHYIGMKHINPAEFWEFTYFPYVIWGMIALGLLFVLLNKRILYLFWAVLMAVLGILGMYDFYKWEYDYGHNLSPLAQIKVPGMAYQPPFLGGKWLLNFYAESWPYYGTYAMILATFFAFFAFLLKKNNK